MMAGEISVTASGKCEGCPYMDLDTAVLHGDYDTPVLKFYRCKRERLCDSLEAYLREEIEGHMIVWFDASRTGPKLHEERDENDGVVYKMSDPVLICTAEGEMLMACHEEDPDTGFDGWITPRSSWVIENVTHWAPLKKPEGMK